jgi:hypothetical protein
LNDLLFYSAKTENSKSKAFLAAYGLIGKKGAVFIVTVEGWLKDKDTASLAIEKMLANIQWKS